MSIAGMRLADQGVYLDAFVCGGYELDTDVLRRRSMRVGWHVSSDPSEFLEIVSPDGIAVELLPWEPGRAPLFWPGTFYPGSPPAQRYEEGCMLQTFMMGTNQPLDPGRYQVRFTEHWQAEPSFRTYGIVNDGALHEVMAVPAVAIPSGQLVGR